MRHALDAAALYAACRSGSEQERVTAFETLGRALFRIAFARVRGRPELRDVAEDSCQEALVVIWRQLEDGRGPDKPESFVGWAARIAVNKLLDEIRRVEPSSTSARSKRVASSLRTSLDADDSGDGRPLGERIADTEQENVDERLDMAALGDLLLEIHVIPDVSESSRIVLMKGFLEGLDDVELAELLGTSRPNVHVIRCRDLAKLRANEDFASRLRALHGL